MPEIDWDAFANRISSAIDEAQESGEIDEPAVIGRIGFGVTRRWMAVAASVVIAAGVAFSVLRDRHVSNPVGPKPPEIAQAIEIKMVDELSADDVAATSQVIVAIGPSSDSKDEPTLWRYADDVVSRSSTVVIASG